MTSVNERNMNLSNQPGMETPDQEDGEMEINLVELLLRLLEKWKIIVAAALAGAIIFGVVTACFIAPTFTATSKLYILNATNSIVNLSDLQLGNALAADYQEVFSNHEVHDRVRERMQLDAEEYDYKKLNEMLSVSNPSDTRLLYITVTAKSAQQASDMANTYAQVAQGFIPEKMDGNAPTIFEEALRPEKKSGPSLSKNTILGFLLGAVIASAVIVVLFIMDDRIRSKEDVEKHLSLPVLGMMPMGQQTADGMGLKDKKNKKGIRKGNKRV